MKIRDIIIFILNTLFCLVFFAASGISFQYFLWDSIMEFGGTKMVPPDITKYIITMYDGYHTNYFFYNTAIACWLVIAYVTLITIWQSPNRIQAYLRIIITSWLSFMLYIAIGAFCSIVLKLPYILIMRSFVEEYRFYQTVEVVVFIAKLGIAFFILAFIARWFLRRIKESEKVVR